MFSFEVDLDNRLLKGLGINAHHFSCCIAKCRLYPVNISSPPEPDNKTLIPLSIANSLISKAFSYAHLDDDQRIVSYFLWNKPETVISLFTDDLRNELETEDVFSPLLETLSRISPTTSPLNKMLYLECKHFLADHNLNYADKMGMATGLEIRVPLLDLELVNFVTRIPLKFKQKFSQGKWIFKKTMEKYLPHEVIYRSKTGFGGPLKFWMNGILKETCDDVFSKESIDSRGIFDYKEIKNLIKLDSSGKVDATYSIFSILCLELWLDST